MVDRKKGKPQDPEQVAKKIGVPYIEAERIVDKLVPDILLSAYRKNPKTEKDRKINEKVQKAFKELLPDSDDSIVNSELFSTFLMGPPGHGKTTAFKEASKKAAELLGMNFVDRFQGNPDIDENTFVFVSEEFSGETSKHGVGGIPGKKEEKGVEFMVHLMPRRIAMLQQAGAGVLLLDDFTNASATVQNIGLSLTQERRYQSTDIGNSYVALTGNLGVLDGTNTSKPSSALLNRVHSYFIQDKLENFIDRGMRQYKGQLGDVGILSFLESNPEYFTEFPSSKQLGPFATPRSWDKAITNSIFSANIGGGAAQSLNKIRVFTSGLLGPKTANPLEGYLNSYYANAAPLAEEAISKSPDKSNIKSGYDRGYKNTEELKEKEKIEKTGVNYDFLQQYTSALVNEAVSKIVTDTKGQMDSLIERFAHGTTVMPEKSVQSAMFLFKRKLANQMDEFSIIKPDGSRDLDDNTKEKITNIIEQSKYIDKNYTKYLEKGLEQNKAAAKTRPGKMR